MLTEERLKEILDYKGRNLGVFPKCCPWSIATYKEILSLAQEVFCWRNIQDWEEKYGGTK
jgi:hypothetical protein